MNLKEIAATMLIAWITYAVIVRNKSTRDTFFPNYPNGPTS